MPKVDGTKNMEPGKDNSDGKSPQGIGGKMTNILLTIAIIFFLISIIMDIIDLLKREKLKKTIQAVRRQQQIITSMQENEIKMKKGKWIRRRHITNTETIVTYICSECRNEPYYTGSIYTYKYCPYCGADMREEENGTN